MSTDNSGRSGLFGRSYSPSSGVTSHHNSLSPYLNIDPAYIIQGGTESQYIFPEGASQHRGRLELAFSQIGGSVLFGAIGGGANGLYAGFKEIKQNQLTTAIRRTHVPSLSKNASAVYLEILITIKTMCLVHRGMSFLGELHITPYYSVNLMFIELLLCRMLNSVTKRGASNAQTLGVIALMYSVIGVILSKTRGAEDELNTLVAATSTGLLYKSTDGVKKCVRGGGIGFILASVYCMYTSKDRVKQMVGIGN